MRRGEWGEGIEIVAVNGLGGIVGHAGEVHDPVGFNEHFVIDHELVRRVVGQCNAHGGGAGADQFAHGLSSLCSRRYFSR